MASLAPGGRRAMKLGAVAKITIDPKLILKNKAGHDFAWQFVKARVTLEQHFAEWLAGVDPK